MRRAVTVKHDEALHHTHTSPTQTAIKLMEMEDAAESEAAIRRKTENTELYNV